MMEYLHAQNKSVNLWLSPDTDELLVDVENIHLVNKIANTFAPGSYFYYVFESTRDQPVFVHPNAKSMVNLDLDHFSSASYWDCVHPEDRESFRKKEQYAAEFLTNYLSKKDIGHYKVCYVIRLRRPDGSYYLSLHQSTVLSTTVSGAVEQVICTETDVSRIGNFSLDRISYIDLYGKNSFLDLNIYDYQLVEENTPKKLSGREVEILKLVSFGLDNVAISNRLHISPYTVKTHRKNILTKEKATSMVQVVSRYIRAGLI